MIKIIKIIKIITLLFVFISCKNNSNVVSPFDIQELRADIIKNIETPINTNFVQSINALNNSIHMFTTNSNEENLVIARNHWKIAAKNYSSIQVLNIGEIKTSYIQNSFFSWVANAKAIEEYIASKKELSETVINSISTNLRGLSAIEHLLFDKNIMQTIQSFTSNRRKKYLNIIGLNLVTKATLFDSKWNTFRKTFVRNNSKGINGSINQIINQMYALLEDVKSYKIGQPAGIEKTNIPNIMLLQAQKSEYSLVLIQNNIKSIRNIYFGQKNGIDDFVSSISKNELLNNKIRTQFETIENSMLAFKNTSLKKAIIDDKMLVKKLYDQIKELLVLIKTDVASVLSITITFTDNDGD